MTRPEGRARPTVRAPAAVLAVALVVLGAVAAATVAVLADTDRRGLSDDTARDRVVESARRVVHVGALLDVQGRFRFAPCSEQPDTAPPPTGENPGPPYTGRVDMTFAIPGHTTAQSYLKNVAVLLGVGGWQTATLAPDSDRWTTVKDGVATVLSPVPDDPDRGRALVVGECDNWTDHRGERGEDISDQLW